MSRPHSSLSRPALLPLLLTLCACQSDAPAPDDAAAVTAARPAADSLDRATAMRRAARIGNLAYDLEIDLNAGAEAFRGRATLRFDLGDARSDLTVDFSGGSVDRVAVAGAPVDAAYNGHFITLPAASLEPGAVEVTIDFSHPYDEDGTGLHRFVDPEDGRTYLYTYLWPYYANRLFPSFDQPNLKAELTLAVLAPADWTVVSTGRGASEPAGDGVRRWTFETTPRMSTYVFSLHAGPYRVWESRAGDVPLRLMARRSLAEYVAVDEWFDVTRRGLGFFGDYYGIPYPFGKYDQLIVPDFNIGAMENIAAVTFSEGYVQRQASNRSDRESRAGVILHEMAHMWFGNLVTHDWWNGMWLNESFATQMAALAQQAVTEFDDTWHGFAVFSKPSAYHRDSRVTTHPIEVSIASTTEFFTIFDSITYAKGASALKQLMHLVGEENYRRGVSSYLRENAYGTTELDDFVSHQADSAGRSLDEWSDEWLYRSGYNALAAEWQCDEGELQSLAVLQTAASDVPLRTHRVDVALYHEDENGRLRAGEILSARVEGASTSLAVAAGMACPAVVNPNHDDWTYAKIALDPTAAAILAEKLGEIDDPLARSMFLNALQDRAQDGDMPLAELVSLTLRLAEGERNVRVLQQVSAVLVSTLELMRRLEPETSAALAQLVPAVESTALRLAGNAATDDVQRLWADTWLGAVASDAGLATAEALLDGEQQLPGITVSADTRWRLLHVLSRHGVPGAAERLEAERLRDLSDAGFKGYLRAHAALPDPATKAGYVAELQEPERIHGLSQQRAVMAGLFPPNQTALQLELLDEVLAALPALSDSADPYFLSSYVATLLRPMCRERSTETLGSAVQRYDGKLNSTATRFLLEAHQADNECRRLRAEQPGD